MTIAVLLCITLLAALAILRDGATSGLPAVARFLSCATVAAIIAALLARS